MIRLPFQRRFVRSAVAVCAMSLASCGGVATPTTPATGTAPTVTAPTVTAEPTLAAPTPGFPATTEPAATAREGAVAVEMAGPPPHFLPGNVTIRAGDGTFFFTNTSLAAHNMAIDSARLVISSERVRNAPLVLSGIVPVGKSATFAVDGLVPGDYYIWCTLSDHAFLGMIGRLTVTP